MSKGSIIIPCLTEKKEHEVILLMDKNDGGWISLGVFDFQGGEG